MTKLLGANAFASRKNTSEQEYSFCQRSALTQDRIDSASANVSCSVILGEREREAENSLARSLARSLEKNTDFKKVKASTIISMW